MRLQLCGIQGAFKSAKFNLPTEALGGDKARMPGDRSKAMKDAPVTYASKKVYTNFSY